MFHNHSAEVVALCPWEVIQCGSVVGMMGAAKMAAVENHVRHDTRQRLAAKTATKVANIPCRFLPFLPPTLPPLPPITPNVKLLDRSTRLEFRLWAGSPFTTKSKSGKNGNVNRASQHCHPSLPHASAHSASGGHPCRGVYSKREQVMTAQPAAARGTTASGQSEGGNGDRRDRRARDRA